MSKNHRSKRRNSRKKKKRNNEAVQIAVPETLKAPEPRRAFGDLPSYTRFAISLVFFLKFISSAKADNLHSGWNGVLFQTNDVNQIQFGLQLDPAVFSNASQVTAQILQTCSNLVQVVQPDWWNDVSIDWQSLYSAPDSILYKTRAEAFMTLSQYVEDALLNINIPNDVWTCFNQVLNPYVPTRFLTDWNVFFQVLFYVGVAAAGIGVSAAAIKVVSACSSYIKSIWGDRSGYDDISNFPSEQVDSSLSLPVNNP